VCASRSFSPLSLSLSLSLSLLHLSLLLRQDEEIDSIYGPDVTDREVFPANLLTKQCPSAVAVINTFWELDSRLQGPARASALSNRWPLVCIFFTADVLFSWRVIRTDHCFRRANKWFRSIIHHHLAVLYVHICMCVWACVCVHVCVFLSRSMQERLYDMFDQLKFLPDSHVFVYEVLVLYRRAFMTMMDLHCRDAGNLMPNFWEVRLFSCVCSCLILHTYIYMHAQTHTLTCTYTHNLASHIHTCLYMSVFTHNLTCTHTHRHQYMSTLTCLGSPLFLHLYYSL